MTDRDRTIADAARDLPVYVPAPDRARVMREQLLAAARAAGLVDVARVAPARKRWPWIAGALALAGAAAAAVLVARPAPRGPRLVALTEGATTLATDAIVVTGDAQVRGSGFEVVVEHGRLQTVRVGHGRAEIRSDTQTIVLVDGQHWEPQLVRAEVIPTQVAVAVAVPPVVDAPVPTRHPTTRKPIAPARVIAEPEHPAAIAKRPIELLFEQGWTELATSPAAAATTFEKAARAAPSDPLAEDAWFWHASALARARSSQTAAALAAFLARYPRSPRAGEASAMLGWLVVDQDLARAETLFHAAAGDRVAAVRASAEKGLALVASRRK